MARVSYLARREGRYYLQVRCSHVVAGLLNQPLFRTSLRTADYRQARRRVAECLGWVYGMNDSIDFAALFAKNVRQLQTYLSDPLPLSDDRLFARRSYEEMLKNLNRRAQARDLDPNASEPRYRALFEAFVEQNLEAEILSRQREKMAAYEQGRTDIKVGIEFGIIPVPGRVAQMPETIRPAQSILTPIDLIMDEAPLAPRQSETSVPSRTDTPLSVALEEYLKKRHKERGHDAERGELGLVVHFMVNQLGDPATGAIAREQLERIERMLPDIPDRLCPSSDNLRPIRPLEKRGSGSSGVIV